MADLTISRNHLQSVMLAAATDANRYNLCGVYFDTDGGKLRLVATNGHILATILTDTEVPEGFTPFRLDGDDGSLSRLDKASRGKDGETIELHRIDSGHYSATVNGMGLELGTEEGGTCFPNWRQVVPGDTAPVDGPIGFDAAYLGRIAAIVAKFYGRTKNHNAPSQWTFAGNLAPAICRATDDNADAELMAVIVSMRL